MKFLFVSLFISLSDFISVQGKHWPPPPSYVFKAKMSRYLMHYADWGIISSYAPRLQQPFGDLASIADGPVGNSTGIPYFYIAKMSTTWQNIAYNNTVSLTLSEAQGDQCEKFNLDPESPVCARVMVTGHIVVVPEQELKFAQMSLFSRHPVMKTWPTTHGWTFCKLNPTGVYLLDFYGGMAHISLKDYFKATPA